MLYVITGANHATGAKTRLEVEAANRAAAERAAQRSGIDVLHCHAANEDPVAHPHARPAHKAQEICEKGACTKLIAIGIVLLAIAITWVLI